MIRLGPGKVFELQIQKSIPDYALLHRLHDSAQSFGGNSSLRFSSKNPFDYLLWDSRRRYLYALELKTVKGKSIGFERTKEEQSEIHYHQIVGLNKVAKFKNTICGFIIEFRALEKTVFIDINDFNKLIDTIPKKSFTFDDLAKYGIPYFVIPQKKKRVRYTYDIDSLLSQRN